MSDQDARIPTKRAAAAIGMPEATLRLWLRPHRAEATAAGYPIATVLHVLRAHDREVARATLEGATATRPVRRRAQPAPAIVPAPEPGAALAAFLEALRAQQETQGAILETQRAILEELRAQRMDGATAYPSQEEEWVPWWVRLLRRLRA